MVRVERPAALLVRPRMECREFRVGTSTLLIRSEEAIVRFLHPVMSPRMRGDRRKEDCLPSRVGAANFEAEHSRHPRADGRPTQQSISLVALLDRSCARSIERYSSGLGFKLTKRSDKHRVFCIGSKTV